MENQLMQNLDDEDLEVIVEELSKRPVIKRAMTVAQEKLMVVLDLTNIELSKAGLPPMSSFTMTAFISDNMNCKYRH